VTSDTHLSSRAPDATANWDAVLGHVDRTRPDLVLRVGDLTLDGMNDARELDRARGLLDRLPVPWHAVPGNHDVGDNPVKGHANEGTITQERQQSWLDTIGPDRWAIHRAGWTLIAVNAQLFGSGLAAEAAQWDWLDEQLESMPAEQPMVLVMHKPLSAQTSNWRPPRHTASSPSRRASGSSVGLDRHTALLEVSGHVHQFRILTPARGARSGHPQPGPCSRTASRGRSAPRGAASSRLPSPPTGRPEPA
jgi:3',5'-cyclic AMP phosphodiesterase CpdA